MKLTQDILKELFEYREDGMFTSRVATSNGKRLPGTLVVGHIDALGYRICSIKNISRKYHRLVFLYHHGWMPRFLDHINQKKCDNRIENLRAATTSQNMGNVKKFKKNASSKFKGVSFHKHMKKYISHVNTGGKLHHLGYFANEKEAALAYDKKAKEVFGSFACLNFP